MILHRKYSKLSICSDGPKDLCLLTRQHYLALSRTRKRDIPDEGRLNDFGELNFGKYQSG